jgi:hypothetical protein
MCVAALWHEDGVRGTHDAELQCETHGGNSVPVAGVLQRVDEVDGIPPGALDDGEGGLRGVRGSPGMGIWNLTSRACMFCMPDGTEA